MTNPAQQSQQPPHHPRGCSSAGSSACPCSWKEGGAKKSSFLPAVHLCPAPGAHSPPWLTEREQEVEEKNRWSRVRGCQPSPRLPFAPALQCPHKGESQRQQGLQRAQPEPQCSLARRRKAKKIQILFSSPPCQHLLPGAGWLPWSRLESSCAKSTWPSLTIVQTLLCPC